MQKHLIPFVLWCLYSVAVSATDLPKADPAEQGFDPAGLQKLNTHFNAYVDDGKLAGYTALVARGGKIVHFNTYGQQNIETNTALQDDSIFRIYSMTKPITGVAMMMLWEDGKFKLDDPVSKYLPSFKNQRVFAGLDEDNNINTVPVNREATIRDLMRHTSGLSYGVFSDTPVDRLYRETGLMNGVLSETQDTSKTTDVLPSLSNLTKQLGHLPLLYQPGDAWVYSLSVDVQGRLIEVLSGLTLEEFFYERIFKPLGMTDTGFFVTESQKDRFVELYALDKEQTLVAYRGDFYSDFTQEPAILSGGGGLVSSTEDYWRFAQMVANGGTLNSTRLLKPETVDLMRRDHLPENLKGIAGGKLGLGFGLNFTVVKDVEKLGSKGRVGEYNWGGMANTLFWIDPVEDIVAVMMVNILPSGIYKLREEMRDHVYGALKE